MTGQRRGYAIALAVAVLALVMSVAAAVAFLGTGSNWSLNGPGYASTSDAWRQGLGGGGGMMGGGRGTMMGGWNGEGTASITPAQAKTAADAWVAANRPGSTAGQGVQMPMGYVFTVTRDGQVVGTIVVNDVTGAVGWFQDGALSAPSPTPSAS